MRLHYCQHVPFEGLAMIGQWINTRGHTLTQTAFFEADYALPALDDYDALIVMGGPMGVYDEGKYEWLAAEKTHIRVAIDAGKPVLGICLGAQLIAASLGAEVLPHAHKEIGWFPVAMTDAGATHPLFAGLNPAMTVFHWHGDRFEIPIGAQHLMSSAACDNQAFVYGTKVLALQFHLEMDVAAVKDLIEVCGDELKPGPWIQNSDWLVQLAESGKTRLALFTLLDNWTANWMG